MIRMVPFANAVAAVVAIFYVLCGVLAAAAPDLYAAIVRTWVHAMDIAVLFPKGTNVGIGSSLLGLVTITAAAWLTAALLATLYNRQVAGEPS